jgi:hypothetical protein
VLGLDADDKAQRGRIKAVLNELLQSGALVRADRLDASRRTRTWIEVGSGSQNDVADFASSPVEDTAPVRAPVRNTTAPLEHEGSLAVLRSSSPPLGGTVVERSGAASSRGAKRTGAMAPVEEAVYSPGQTFAVPLTSDGSEFL